MAFVETAANATRLVAVDRAAAEVGLGPGLTLADARARVPELEVFDHDAHADHAWLERLAEACGRYTPVVMLQPPDALTLDIAGCTHAFDGERFLAADVEARFARRGVLARHAFGDTPAIAEALARFAGAPAPDERGAVRRLPVAALGLDHEATVALQRAGVAPGRRGHGAAAGDDRRPLRPASGDLGAPPGRRRERAARPHPPRPADPRRAPLRRADRANRVRAGGDGRAGGGSGRDPRSAAPGRPPLAGAALPHRRRSAGPARRDRAADPRPCGADAVAARADRRARRPARPGLRL